MTQKQIEYFQKVCEKGNISLAAEKSLMCLRISFEYECRIFFHESGETLCHLLVLILVCSLNCYEVAWVREYCRVYSYLLSFAAECIACLGVLELAESYEVSGSYTVCVLLVLTSYEEDGTEFLGLL